MRKSLITELITGPEIHKVHISIDGLCRAAPGPEPLGKHLEAERGTESNQSLAAIGLFCFFIFVKHTDQNQHREIKNLIGLQVIISA